MNLQERSPRWLESYRWRQRAVCTW